MSDVNQDGWTLGVGPSGKLSVPGFKGVPGLSAALSGGLYVSNWNAPASQNHLGVYGAISTDSIEGIPYGLSIGGTYGTSAQLTRGSPKDGKDISIVTGVHIAIIGIAIVQPAISDPNSWAGWGLQLTIGPGLFIGTQVQLQYNAKIYSPNNNSVEPISEPISPVDYNTQLANTNYNDIKEASQNPHSNGIDAVRDAVLGNQRDAARAAAIAAAKNNPGFGSPTPDDIGGPGSFDDGTQPTPDPIGPGMTPGPMQSGYDDPNGLTPAVAAPSGYDDPNSLTPAVPAPSGYSVPGAQDGYLGPGTGYETPAERFGRKFGENTKGNDGHVECFPAAVAILCPEGGKQISDIRAGDIVLAFLPQHGDPQSALTPRRVTRLFRNVTREWLKITPASGHEAAAGHGGFTELVVTPGHRILAPDGEFRQIERQLRLDPRLVLADGSLLPVQAERIVYSAETAHLFETASKLEYRSMGGVALDPELVEGWATYNFEVEELHTYIAGNVRVHNDSKDLVGYMHGLSSEFTYASAYDAMLGKYGINVVTAVVNGINPQTGFSNQDYADAVALAGKLDAIAAQELANGNIEVAAQNQLAADLTREEADKSRERGRLGHQDLKALQKDDDENVVGIKGFFESFGSFLSGIFGPNSNSSPGEQEGNSDNSGTASGGPDPGRGGESGTPILLDLNGDGVRITARDQSNIFFDMAGDGYKHRTAWAAAGDGVLAIDADGDGLINRRNEIVFTDWDPSAESDFAALRSVFDTNGNQQLDSGDARWASFRIVVTNADGTTTVRSLSELGITSISLVGDKMRIVLPDGSSISEQSTFTRNGVTGVAADARLSYDAEGHAVQNSVTTAPDGSTVIDNRLLAADGLLAGSIKGTTSADGMTVTLRLDRDGDGVVDDVQSRVRVIAANGLETETLENATAAGRLIDRSVTTTSADAKTIMIARDFNGDTFVDQSESRVTAANNSQAASVADLSRDGTLIQSTTTTVSADGLTRNVQFDIDGNATSDVLNSDATVVAGDGSRTRTIETRAQDSSLSRRDVQTTSANGRIMTSHLDEDGDGNVDRIESVAVTLGANGGSTTSEMVNNRNGSLRGSTSTTTSSDGLVITTLSDLDGVGGADRSRSDVTVLSGDGSRIETAETRNGTGSVLLAKTTTMIGADGRTRTTEIDADGDGVLDRTEVIALNGAGISVATVSELAGNGALVSRSVSTTSANGLARIDQLDVNGDSAFDTIMSTNTVLNGDGSSTQTVETTNGDGSLRQKASDTTSANGLVIARLQDLDGNGITDWSQSDVTTLNADGSKTRIVDTRNGTGSVRLSSETIIVSADRQTTTINRDVDGDTITDQTDVAVIQANGSNIRTVRDLNANGTLKRQTVATESANGLSTIVRSDLDGNGTDDVQQFDDTVLGTNGSRTRTVSSHNGDGSLRTKTTNLVSANQLSVTSHYDFDGIGGTDQTVLDTTTLDADGSRTQTLSTYSQTSLLDKTTRTVSANGLAIATSWDLTGDQVADRSASDVTTLNMDGSWSRVVETRNGTGLVLLSKTTTTESADRKTTSIVNDVDGDSLTDHTDLTVLQSDGSRVRTIRDLNPNGTLVGQVVVSASANGMSITTRKDLDGNGTDDVRHSDETVLGTNGSRTRTLGTYNGDGSLRLKTSDTASANGLVIARHEDLDGNGAADWSQSDVTALNADGSKTRTVSESNANGSLRARETIFVSADRQTTTINRDTNGDGADNQTIVEVTQADGSVVGTASRFATNGALIGRTVETTNATGLSVISLSDHNGDGLVDQTLSSVTVLNNDGSKTTTVQETSNNGTLIGKTVSNISDDGLLTTIESDLNGDGALDLKSVSGTTLNANGSSTTSASRFNRAATLIGKTVTTVSYNGLSTIVQSDIDGNGVTDVISTDVTQLNTDGSRNSSFTQTLASGTIQNRTSTYLSADGQTSSSSVDRNGDGAADFSIDKAVLNNGDRVSTSRELDNIGQIIRSVSETVSANGLSSITRRDYDGDSAIDLTWSDILAVNNDGSWVRTESHLNGNESLRGKTVTTTSATGLSQVTKSDVDGNAVFETTRSSSTILNADGGRTETITTTNANSTLRSRTVTTVSDDRETASTTHDLNGDDSTDRTETRATLANGNVVETRSNFSATGNLVSKVVVTTTANNFSSTLQRDLNGDGVFDRVQTRSTSILADGGRSTSFIDNAYTGAGGSIATLKGSTQTTISGNGYTKSVAYDALGPTWAANVFKRTAEDVTVFAADGARVQTVTTYNPTAAVLNRSTVSVSGNGLVTTENVDVDGNSTNERIRSVTFGVDGSRAETVESRNLVGALATRSVTSVNFDGSNTQVLTDTNGDGVHDRTNLVTVNANRSVTNSLNNFASTGALKDTVTTTIGANGLSRTTQVDSNGDGIVDISARSNTVLNYDGSQTIIVSTLNGNGRQLKTMAETTSVDGLIISSSVDSNGDGATDYTESTSRILNDNGLETTTVDSRYADNSLRRKIVVTESADGRTTTDQSDSDGNGFNDEVVTSILNADETRTINTQYFSHAGASTGSSVETRSADGLSTRTVWGNGTVDKTEYVPEANGSYTWSRGVGASLATSFLGYGGYSTGAGWSNNNNYPRKLGDVNGDGRADIVGFASDGVYVSLGLVNGTFAQANRVSGEFASWTSQDLYPREIGDVNGDGRADIVGFASTGAYVALGQANGTFATSFLGYGAYGTGAGWSSNNTYPRKLGDVNGDGRADIVGFASDGVYVSLGLANGTFASANRVSGEFASWTSQDLYPREIGDVNGDGRADIVGFASTGAYVALGQANGTFATSFLGYSGYSTGAGWSSNNNYPRKLGDVNGDGRADIVGIASDGVYVSLGLANGTFGQANRASSEFGSWTSQGQYPREVGDVNGDGRADIVGFASTGTYVALGKAVSDFQSAHSINLNGIDTWTTNENGEIRTLSIDLESKRYYLAQANRIYSVALGRQMSTAESEMLIKYFNHGVLNTTQLALDLRASTEFVQRYGTLSDAQFFDRLHQNAFERGATLADLNKALSELAAGTLTRTGAIIALSESAEMLTRGTAETATEKAPGSEVHELERITDKALAMNMASRLYDVAFNRLPTATESATVAQALMGGMTPIQVVTTLVASTEFAVRNGASLSNASFVEKMFANALGRAPTVTESQQWVLALNSSRITRAELVYAISETPEHAPDTLSTVDGTANADYLAAYNSRDMLYGWGGNDTLVGGAGTDPFHGGDGDDHIHGLDGDDAIFGGGGSDFLHGGAGADELNGGDGDDTLIGGGGNDHINGGAGNDVLVLNGDRADFEFTYLSAIGRYSIKDKRNGSPEGTDFADVEVFRLNDGEFTQANLNAITDNRLIGTVNADDKGGSRTVVGWENNGSSTLAINVSQFDALNRKTSESATQSDGSRVATLWDVANTYDWSRSVNRYDSSGRLASAEVFFDNQTKQTEVFDAGSTQNWQRITEVFNSQGSRTTTDVLLDSGGRSSKTWDTASQYSWSYIVSDYDNAGRMTWQAQYGDNGFLMWGESYDANNQQIWSSFVNYYDNLGRKVSQVGYHETRNYYWAQYYDVENLFSWSYYTKYYDSLGRNTSETGHYDNDKLSWAKYWDTTNQYSWSYYTNYYDTSERVTSQLGYHDNGNLAWGNYWDVNNQYSWHSYVDYYNTSGQKTSQVTYSDSGNPTWVYF